MPYFTLVSFLSLVFRAFHCDPLVISAGLLIAAKEREVLRLRKQIDNSMPKLDADFSVYAVAPAGMTDQSSIILITGRITNTGAPSIVKNIGVEVKVGDKSVQGQSYALFTPHSPFFGELGGKPIELKTRFEDHWVRNCSSQPIVTGGGAIGSHEMFFPNVTADEVFSAGTIVTLSFQDVNGKRYEFTRIMTGQIDPH